MQGLTTALLGQACRIFLDRAYPAGPHTIPSPINSFLALDASRPLETILVPPLCEALPPLTPPPLPPKGGEGDERAPALSLVHPLPPKGGEGQGVRGGRREGGVRGYALRLGSAGHPHLKLQIVDDEEGGCLFCVDTHDGFTFDSSDPHTARWSQLQAANRRLKEEIERAWEEAGLLTFNALLRRELARQT